MGQLKHVEDASDSFNLLAFGQYIPDHEPTPLILGCHDLWYNTGAPHPYTSSPKEPQAPKTPLIGPKPEYCPFCSV